MPPEGLYPQFAHGDPKKGQWKKKNRSRTTQGKTTVNQKRNTVAREKKMIKKQGEKVCTDIRGEERKNGGKSKDRRRTRNDQKREEEKP